MTLKVNDTVVCSSRESRRTFKDADGGTIVIEDGKRYVIESLRDNSMYPIKIVGINTWWIENFWVPYVQKTFRLDEVS